MQSTKETARYQDFVERLFPLLKCPSCGSYHLELVSATQQEQWRIKLYDQEISCSSCDTRYPITEDIIPIMWTPAIKSYLQGQSQDSGTAIDANMSVYDSFSDDYHEFSRTSNDLKTRVQNCVKAAIPDQDTEGKYHLDFGCGPGHVLGWLSDYKFVQIGLDVSMANLHNVRKYTNAFVVCGDATNLPFRDKTFDLVTESSALHHIEDWKQVLRECCRVCLGTGGIVIDSEPSAELMNWSKLAILLFESRFIPYRIMGYLFPKSRFYNFRSVEIAKLNACAEIHHQPKTGFDLKILQDTFSNEDFQADIILSPLPSLEPKSNPSKQQIILHLLSLHNPWDLKYSSFTAIARPQLQ
jgi:ubiquinone/menaquinone biosynthesis C-methylase UbiE/uncharacterized protein YbaR (Trm112 family)